MMGTSTRPRHGARGSLWGVILILLIIAGPWPKPWRQELSPGYWERSTLPTMGLATYYAPGLMDYVLNYRLQRGQLPECPDCVGAVALLRAGDIGRKVWLQPPGGELAGPFIVVDCARPEDVQPLLDRGWVVDISYELAETWGMQGPLDAVKVWYDPAEGNSPAPPGVPTLYYIDPKDVIITAPTPTSGVSAGASRLPTRLPAPIGTPRPAASSRALPTPLTPSITTPTPPGAAQVVAGHLTALPPPTPPLGPGGVYMGRPGEMLLAMARPAVGKTPTVPGVTRPPSVTPSPVVQPGATSEPILPSISATPAPAPEVRSNGGLLQEIWRALGRLLSP